MVRIPVCLLAGYEMLIAMAVSSVLRKMPPSQMDGCRDPFLETTRELMFFWHCRGPVLPCFEKVRLPYPFHPLYTCLVVEFVLYDKKRGPSILATATESRRRFTGWISHTFGFSR